MKHKIIFPLLLMFVAAVTFTGCAGEEDDIFSATAAERLNESSAKYSARLEAQPNGWVMQYYPTYADEYPYGSGYLILMDFNPDYSVRVAMNNAFCGNVFTTDTSVWEVIADNGPVLTFNSYNACMHAFSDPEDIAWTEDSEQSEGCGGDYEFIVVDAPEDASYMMLKGKKRGTYNLLTPIEEGVDYEQYLTDVKAFHNKMFSATAPVGNYINFADTIYNIEDANDGMPSIYPLGADKITFENFNPFLITKRGEDFYLRFRDAFSRDDMEGTLQELRYDRDQDKFIGTDNPLFTIEGYPVVKFFKEHISGESKAYWTLSKTGEMSEKMQTYMSALDQQFSALKDSRNRSYTFVSVRLGYDTANDIYQWSVLYRMPGSSSSTPATYNFDTTESDDVFAFTYNSPSASTNAENIYNTTSSVASILNVLSQSFRVEKVETRFDLTRLKLTSTSDSDLWFIVTM